MKFYFIKRSPQIQTGSALMRLLDKSSLSKIDLLIRESVQNSFDAQKPKVEYIDYKIFSGEFNTKDFLEIINDVEVCAKNEEEIGKCLVIQDYNTVGLNGLFEDGKIDYSSSFYKLIYDNGNPQSQESAGGSWGYGKTIYYQVGIGIVLYYTRTINNGQYEESLIINLIEDEKSHESILNKNKYDDNVGIAYWGSNNQNNIMFPVNNKREIEKILKIFNVKQYEKLDTGTTIIIPFIDEEDLINDYICHLKEESDDFKDDLNEIIINTIAKWFTLKISNELFKKYINFYVNNEKIETNNIKKAYKVVQELYNAWHIEEKNGINVREIRINQELKDSIAGHLIYKVFRKEELNMVKPINEKNPFYYYNVNNSDEMDGMNAAIVAYCREPGMIINYETGTEWVKSVNPTNNNEYLIALFVLNSKNEVLEKNISLNGYVRKGEASNHNGWTDFNSERKIVVKIKRAVNRALKNFTNKKPTIDDEIETSMGQYYTKYFIPPLGFGKLPSRIVKNKGNGNNKTVKTRKGSTHRIMYSLKELNNDKVIFEFRIHYKNNFEKIRLYLAIDSLPANTTTDTWQMNTNIEFPFSIITQDSKNNDYSLMINNTKNYVDITNSSNVDSIIFELEIKINDNKYSPVFI